MLFGKKIQKHLTQGVWSQACSGTTGTEQVMFYCVHRLRASLQHSSFTISTPNASYPLTRRFGKTKEIYDTGFVDLVVIFCGDAKSVVQGLRELTAEDNEAKKRARYQKFTKEKIQSIMLKLQDDSRVIPTITGYYRASTAPTFLDEAAAAFRRRVGGALKDTLKSIEYDRVCRSITTNT